jgi:hypothetical protein
LLTVCDIVKWLLAGSRIRHHFKKEKKIQQRGRNHQMSDTSSSSNASSDSDTFNQSELSDIIAILLLPKDAKVDLEITKWKDKDLSELLTLLFENYTFDDCNFKQGFGKIITFINTNRKVLEKKRRVFNLDRIEDDRLYQIISDGLDLD